MKQQNNTIAKAFFTLGNKIEFSDDEILGLYFRLLFQFYND